MLLYLAGLKGVDPSLREAAAVDGASETQTFFRVVFPVMRPINIIVLVVTVIESLRAFDLVWVINKGRNGLELIVDPGHRATSSARRAGSASARRWRRSCCSSQLCLVVDLPRASSCGRTVDHDRHLDPVKQRSRRRSPREGGPQVRPSCSCCTSS